MEVANERTITMTTKVKYYLDETDQIEVDGHTLSRLYLANDSINKKYMSRYAVFGEDNSYREMGGYVESLDNLSDEPDSKHQSGDIAWVDAKSKVYGASKIQFGARVNNSTIIDSNVHCDSLVCDSVISNSKVKTVMNSEIYNSYCYDTVEDSVIKNSDVENYTINSTISDSTITNIKYSRIINANLTNVEYHGSISGTFSDVQEDDIERYQLSYRNQFDEKENMHLLVGPSSTSVMQLRQNRIKLVNDKTIPVGDISLERLSSLLNEVVDDQPIGGKKALKLLDKLSEREILTDADLDFGKEMERTI